MNNMNQNNLMDNPMMMGMLPPNIEVVRFALIASGTYQDLQFRPYQGHIPGNALNAFMEQTRGGTDVSVATLAGISGYFMSPTTQSQGTIAIPNGFNTARTRWFLLVKVTRPGPMTLPYYQAITGFTDYQGLDFANKRIDPNMPMRINSIMTLNTMQNPGQFVVQDNSHVLHQQPQYTNALVGNTGFTPPALNTLMPEDVIGHIGFGNLGNAGMGDGFDGRLQSAMSPVVKSSRSNSLTTTYLEQTLNAYSGSILSPDMVQADQYAIASAARGLVRENPLHSDQFLKLIRQRTDYDARGSFTYGEINQMIPGIDAIAEVVDQRVHSAHNNAASGFGSTNLGNFETWNNQTPETMFATRLIQAVPSIMMELCISRCNLRATNMVTDGSESMILPMSADSLVPGYDLDQPLRRLVDRLRVEVFRDLSMHNQITYAIVMQVNIFGDTLVKVALNGGPEIDYCMPSFCDSLAVPVIAPNSMAVNSVASTVQGLVDFIINPGAIQ